MDLELLDKLNNNMVSYVAKDEFDKKIDKMAEIYASENIEHPHSDRSVLSCQNEKERQKNLFRQSIKLDEYHKYIVSAFQILKNLSKSHLNPEQWKELQHDLQNLFDIFKKINIDTNLTDKPYLSLGLSRETLGYINKMGRDRYNNREIESFISLCTLLTTLDPLNPIYWLELGIGFQDFKKYEQALKAYAVCHLQDPSLISSWVYSAECYLRIEMIDDATIELEEAKQLMESQETEDIWRKVIDDLDSALKFAA